MSTELFYDGNDIIDDVIISTARFTSQVNSVGGLCIFRVKDNDRTRSFTTGKDLELVIDGRAMWTGFVTKVNRVYPFDAKSPAERLIELEGIDVNILFKKRITYKQANPASLAGPTYPANTNDTTAIADLVADWLDLTGDGIDTSSLVDNVGTINETEKANPWSGSWEWGQAMASIARLPAAIYYIDPDKKLVYCDVDTPSLPWVLTDQPAAVASGVGYREMTFVNDGSQLANDVMIWGMSGGSPTPVFKRLQSTTSQTAHGVWQYAEVRGDVYKQATVDRIADSYINGSPQSKRGHKDDRRRVQLTTYDPSFRPSDKARFISAVYGIDEVFPVRSSTISFPASPSEPRFDLVLSHEIDLPIYLFDVIRFSFPPFPPFPPPPDIPGPEDTETGECICGTTDSFERTEVSGWGTSDAGPPWAIINGDVNAPTTASGFITFGLASLTADTASGVSGIPVAKAGMGSLGFDPFLGEIHYKFKCDEMSTGVGTGVLLSTDAVANNTNLNSALFTNWMWITFGRIHGGPANGKMGFFLESRRSGITSTNGGLQAWNGQPDADEDVWYEVKIVLVPSVGNPALLAPKFKVWNPALTGEPASYFEYTGSNGRINSAGPIQHFALLQAGTAGLTRTAVFSSLAIFSFDRCGMVQFDAFDRLAFPGPSWGTSTSGAPWTVVSSSGNVRVDANEGFVIEASGQGATLRVTPPMTSSFEMWSSLRRSVIPTGSNHLDTTFDLGNGKKVKFIVSSGSPGKIELGSSNLVSVVKTTWTTAAFHWRMTWDASSGALKFRYWAVTVAEPSTWDLETTEPGAIGDLDVVFANVGAGTGRQMGVNFIEFYYDGKPCYAGGPLGGDTIFADRCETLDTDGISDDFTLSRGYQEGSLYVTVNGLFEQPGIHYTETSPIDGTFHTEFVPAIDDVLRVCYTPFSRTGGG